MIPHIQHSSGFLAGAILAALLWSAVGWQPAAAQSLSSTPIDLQFEILNATTGQPGTIERLQLQYSTVRLEGIFDIQPEGSTFTVPETPIRERGKYILTAWCQGVPYYWSLRGRDLMKAPVQLPVFDIGGGLQDVSIIGLDLLVRKTESLLELEYMLQVDNAVRPQITLNTDPRVALTVPAGSSRATLSYGNGPEPEEMIVGGTSGGTAVLGVPLTTGRNQMRLRLTLPWAEGLEIPVGANVPIKSWSLMVTPATLDIQAFDLKPADTNGLNEYSRYQAPPVPADKPFRCRLSSTVDQTAAEDLFTKTSPDQEDQEPAADQNEKSSDKGFPFVVLTPILVVILAALARKRRRS